MLSPSKSVGSVPCSKVQKPNQTTNKQKKQEGFELHNGFAWGDCVAVNMYMVECFLVIA